MTELKRFWKDTKAASSIEYSILAVGIAIVIIVAVQSIGSTTNTTIQSVDAGLQ